VQFFGKIERQELAQALKIRAEGKIKFFLWLLLQNKLWTSNRLPKEFGRMMMHATFAIRLWKPPFILH
jgi:hypothetical protein